MLVVALSVVYTRAQDDYEIQVYGYELVAPGHAMVELHSNFTIDGFKETVDGVYPTNHAEHETVEIAHGFSDWFESGFDPLSQQQHQIFPAIDLNIAPQWELNFGLGRGVHWIHRPPYCQNDPWLSL
jgi:hypothetical protein